LCLVLVLYLPSAGSAVCQGSVGEAGGDSPAAGLRVCYSPGFNVGDALSLYLPFSEGGGAVAFDRSGSGNHGVVVSEEPVVWVEGWGLCFDGLDGYVEVADDEGLGGGSATWACRFRLDDLTLDNRVLLGKSYNMVERGDLEVWQWGNEVICRYSDGAELYDLYSAVPSEGEWHHLAVVLDEARDLYVLYVDGVAADSDVYRGGTEENRWNLTVGGSGVGGRTIRGAIREVRVYDRALSPLEVAELCYSGVETPRADPGSGYVVGGWVQGVGPSSPGRLEGVGVYLDGALSAVTDGEGCYRFVLGLPREVGSHVYELTADGASMGGGTSVTVVVDRVLVEECGGGRFYTGHEGVAWFRLVSEHDGRPVALGGVTLSDGGEAEWSPGASRWEYRVTSGEEAAVTLTVESVVWGRYGVSVLGPGAAEKAAEVRWVRPPFYYPVVSLVRGMYVFLASVPLLAWAAVVLFLVFAVLVRLGLIEIEVEERPVEG